MALYWKKEIITDMKAIWKGEEASRQFCGAMLDPKEFFPIYLRRILERKKLDGEEIAPGYYTVKFKVNQWNNQLNLN